jgi:uncharacterized protein YndB with AHSA1/START domain
LLLLWQNNGMAEKTRAYAARVDIEAPPARVWAALSTNSALERWMSPGTRIAAQVGGLFSGSLDRKRHFTARVDIFDAPRRIRIVHLQPEEMPGFDAVIVDDIMVEPRGAETLVRVLGEGFPRADEYGEFYMRRQLGWRQSLARLKVYLENEMDLAPTRAPSAAKLLPKR